MKKRLLAFLLAAGMVVGQALPAYAANGNEVQQGDIVQTESEAQLLNADEIMSETRYMYLEDYPTTWYEFENYYISDSQLQVSVEDPGICQYVDYSGSGRGLLQFKALKVGKTAVTVSWQAYGGETYQMTFNIVVKEKMPSDGIIIQDEALRDKCLKYERMGNDGYISKEEMKSISYLSVRNMQKMLIHYILAEHLII